MKTLKKQLLTILLAASVSACGNSTNNDEPPTDMSGDLLADATPDIQDMGDMAPDASEDMPSDASQDQQCDETTCNVITWENGPSIEEGVDHHMTTLQQVDGQTYLIVAGGFKALGNDPNPRPEFVDRVVTAKINADGTLANWENTTALPVPLAGAPIFNTKDGGIIIPSGRVTQDGQLRLSDVVFYNKLKADGTLGEWTRLGQFPEPRFHHAGATDGTYLFTTGGLFQNDATDKVFVAKYEDGEQVISPWRETTALPKSRTHHSSFVHKGYLYVVGGFTGALGGQDWEQNVIRAQIKDGGDLGAWEQYATLPSRLGTHANTIYKNYIYLFGGINAGGFSKQVLRAQLTDDGIGAWNVLNQAVMPRPIGHTHHVPIWQDKAYIVSGGTRLELSNQVHIGTISSQ